MYQILVAGAGYLGGEIARYFAGKKQKVTALIRTPSREALLREAGIEPLKADLTDAKSLRGRLKPVHFVILSVAPDLQDTSSLQALFLAGIRNLLAELKTLPRPKFLLMISSTGVWPKNLEGLVDESTPCLPDTERGKILLEAERQVLTFGFPAAIFRLAGLYGPGRNHLDALLRGLWPKPGLDRMMNMIHRDDAVSAVQPLLNHAKAGEVYIGSDHEPALQSEVYRWLASKTGQPFEAGRLQKAEHEGKRYSNQKLRALKFNFRYPSFRVGYEALLRSK